MFVFCSDGVSEAMNEAGQEFSTDRLMAVVERSRHLSAADTVTAIFAAVEEFRAGAAANDDTTAVVVKITN
jgi:serine phosphatase RsbU (regulator of sigma subunit)